jgi:hypothetical protein
MAESSVYDAALEVREAVYETAHELAAIGADVSECLGRQVRRRDIFAAQLMAEFVRHKLTISHPVSLKDPLEVENLVKLSWQLADALEVSDPQRRPAKSAGLQVASASPDAS